jgi:hypothetical protein
MIILGSVSEGNVRRRAALIVPLLLAVCGCRSERVSLGGEATLVTQVQMVRPAAQRQAAVSSAIAPAQQPEPDAIDEANEYCRQVEQQARDTHAGLPKRLDRDTSATRVAAYGCDVVLEYAMHDLSAEEVSADGLRALRSEVVKKLCSDRGARGVMDRGGSFTNVYRDQHSALIDQFMIAAEDCTESLSAAGAPVSFEL